MSYLVFIPARAKSKGIKNKNLKFLKGKPLISYTLEIANSISKKIKASNYQIDTYKKRIYIYGIAITSEERDLVLEEAKEILDVEDIIASIMLVEDLRIQKN